MCVFCVFRILYAFFVSLCDFRCCVFGVLCSYYIIFLSLCVGTSFCFFFFWRVSALLLVGYEVCVGACVFFVQEFCVRVFRVLCWCLGFRVICFVLFVCFVFVYSLLLCVAQMYVCALLVQQAFYACCSFFLFRF